MLFYSNFFAQHLESKDMSLRNSLAIPCRSTFLHVFHTLVIMHETRRRFFAQLIANENTLLSWHMRRYRWAIAVMSQEKIYKLRHHLTTKRAIRKQTRPSAHALQLNVSEISMIQLKVINKSGPNWGWLPFKHAVLLTVTRLWCLTNVRQL